MLAKGMDPGGSMSINLDITHEVKRKAVNTRSKRQISTIHLNIEIRQCI